MPLGASSYGNFFRDSTLPTLLAILTCTPLALALVTLQPASRKCLQKNRGRNASVIHCTVVVFLKHFGEREGSRCSRSWAEGREEDRQARFPIL